MTNQSHRWPYYARRNQRGGASLKGVLGLLIVAGIVYASWVILPPCVANYRLEDEMRTEAAFAQASRKSQEDVQNDIYQKTKELGIAVKKDAIKVENTGAVLRISVQYSVPIDLPGYSFNLNFSPQADNHSI